MKTNGHEDAHDSYREELAGLLAILTVIQAAIKCFHINDAKATISCDNDGALFRCFVNEKPATANDTHWDYITLIQSILSSLPTLQLQWIKVKGHKDSDPTANVTQWEIWNILMDLRAKWCREQPGQA